MVSKNKKEYEIVLNCINALYNKQRDHLALLETPFEVKNKTKRFLNI